LIKLVQKYKFGKLVIRVIKIKDSIQDSL